MGAFGICVANGHNSDAVEVVRSLFSWAEFMAEEPVERQNRRGKKEASSLSMFEWALSLEWERGGDSRRRTLTYFQQGAAIVRGRCLPLPIHM